MGVIGAEIAQEVASGPAVVASSVRIESGGERIDCTVNQTGQRMF